jgi:hypothetical protein
LRINPASRRFGASSNDVGSFDTRVRLNKQWYFDAQAVTSSTTALDGTHTTGSSVYADVSRSGRAFTYTLSYQDASPNFKTQMGFVPRTDYRQATNFLTLRWYPKKGPVIDFGPNSFVQGTWDYAGHLTDWVVRFPFQLDLKGQTSLFGRHALIQETVGGVALREREDILQFNSSYLRWMSVSLSYGHGTRPNYSPAAGLTPFLGTFTDVSAGLTFRPVSALVLDETLLYSRLDSRPGGPGTGAIFTNPILRSRANYQFSREWSLRAIVDYNDISPNTSLVDLQRARHAGLDLLLTWLLHPGTALYVGYSDGYDNQRLDAGRITTTTGALGSTGRQVFIKTSYLFRF